MINKQNIGINESNDAILRVSDDPGQHRKNKVNRNGLSSVQIRK